jgi:transmembrane 9 superfamily protein 2/4
MTPKYDSICAQVELKVNKLTSVHTQIPFDYYTLKFCRPKGGIQHVRLRLALFE